MSTTYGNLPAVDLPRRWDHVIVATVSKEDDDGVINARIHTVVTATSAQEAESRSLAVMDYDYEDDLRGATAEATGNSSGRWSVTITMRPYR